jgi:hypothetical protein
VRVRDGRATVTGTQIPEVRNSPAANSFYVGTLDPEEVSVRSATVQDSPPGTA